MNPASKHKRLADAIRSRMADGFIIDCRARNYMDACLPEISVDALTDGVCDAPEFEVAPLMDLLFFPDIDFQIKIEPLLERERYDHSDEAAVVALLTTETIQTALVDSVSPGKTTIPFPPSTVAPFVCRLGISRHIPPKLAGIIESVHPPDTATRVKVTIRNARIALTETTARFLELFFMGMPPGDQEHGPCLDSLLGLFGEGSQEPDPFRRLRSGIDSLYRAREAALAFEKQLQAHNMETLMQMGARAPETGPGEAQRKIELLEKIGDAVALGGVMARRKG